MPAGEIESGESRGLLFRLSLPGETIRGGPVPSPLLGEQLGTAAIPGFDPEGQVEIGYREIPGRYPDGQTYSLREPVYRLEVSSSGQSDVSNLLLGPRLAPPVFGLGLLEAVEEATILSRADPEDRDGDGISGRPNFVINLETGESRLGRFGWKANQPTLLQQVSAAFANDIGITTRLHPEESLGDRQRAMLGAIVSGGSPELEDRILDRVVLYQQTLAPPARRNVRDEGVMRGESLFRSCGCAACHVPEMRTSPSFTPVEELAGQLIRPFTDLLLHDMGVGLSDGRPDYEASGREWRTPPLWGIGLLETVNGHQFLLHDGRARGIEEAILWHGGEAEASRIAFEKMDASDRDALLSFLRSL